MSKSSLNISSRAAFSYNWNKGLDREKSCSSRTKDSIMAFLKGLFCGYKVLVSDVIDSGLLGGGHDNSIFVKEYHMKFENSNAQLTEASASGEERDDTWEKKYRSASSVRSNSLRRKRVSNIEVNPFKDQDVNQLLREAAKKGDIKLLNKLLDNSSTICLDINAKEDADGVGKKGRTALHYAVMYGHDNIVKRLLMVSDIFINEPDNVGATPLLYAAERGHEDCLHLLLEQGNILVNTKDTNGTTPLIYAAEKGHIGCLNALLDHPDTSVHATDNSGWTALHAACCEDNVICVKRLLKEANILLRSLNRKTTDKNRDEQCTPFGLAIRHDSKKCINLLREKNFDY